MLFRSGRGDSGVFLLRFLPLALWGFSGSEGVMAGLSTGRVDFSAGGSRLAGKAMSIRETDSTSKGKSTEDSGSSSTMPGDDVAKLFGRLNLTSQEANAFVLDDEEDDYPGCPEWAIVGKVLAPNPLHISTIKAALRPAWGNPKGLEQIGRAHV